MINIQGLTNLKTQELLENWNEENQLLCITETQQKYMKIKLPDRFNCLESCREDRDKKGGGLLIVYQPKKNISIEKIDSKNADILISKVIISRFKFKIYLVYLASNDFERTRNIIKTLEYWIDKESVDSNFLVLGDFNAHLGFLGPQKINREGKRVLDMILEYNLAILNCDMKCEGEITWSNKNSGSAIDFVLASMNIQKHFIHMKIDENKEEYDLSDHNLITAVFEFKKMCTEDENKIADRKWCYSMKEEKLKKYGEEIRKKIIENRTENMGNLNELMIKEADNMLKIELKVIPGNETEVEKTWFNNEIREAIHTRKMYNRKKRNETNQELKEIYNKKYEEAKEKAEILVYRAMTIFEEKSRREIETEKDFKKVWKHVDKLRKGTNINKDKQITVYDENGNKLEKDEQKVRFRECWEKIYQKHENDTKINWNENIQLSYEESYRIVPHESQKYEIQLREHLDMCKKIVRSEVSSMKEVKITEDDVSKQIKKMKKGKAAGPDGLKIEMYKEAIKDKESLSLITKCYVNTIKKKKMKLNASGKNQTQNS